MFKMLCAPWLVISAILISFLQVCCALCGPSQYLCRNSRCIHRNHVCDGDNDCLDQSDEDICVVRSCSNPVLFKCGGDEGNCISVMKVCDGIEICSDGSDERDCRSVGGAGSGSGTCEHPALFRCADGLCISKSFVCDRNIDCTDGSDENLCFSGIRALSGVESSRERAIFWLNSKRNNKWGWDDNTHRAIVALYLSDGAMFDGTKEEEELMAKQLELKVSLALLRNETIPVTPNQMALYINAMLVTCHNPRNFYGFDLVNLLKQMIHSKQNSTHPIVYLALCNANETVSADAVNYLLAVIGYESEYLFWTDIQAMAVIALTCITGQGQYAHLAPNISAATTNFKKQQRTDGSFGNIYTSAMVLQALLASGAENEKNWDLEGAIKYLQSKQNANENYSFGDFLTTYLALPVMRGRSLADIAHVKCSNLRRQPRDSNSVLDFKNYLGPFVYVTYSLYIGDDMKSIHPISLKVPSNITVYDIMNLAAEIDPKYRYESKRSANGLYIYSIMGIANDSETGMFWLMHLGKIDSKEADLKTQSPDQIFIKGGEHIIMWYKTANIET